MFAAIILVSEEYSINHLQKNAGLEVSQPATIINVTTTVTTLLNRFPSVLLYLKLKTSQAKKFPDLIENRLNEKTLLIPKFSHPKLGSTLNSGFKRHDQTGEILFRIRPLAC